MCIYIKDKLLIIFIYQLAAILSIEEQEREHT
jgi:hypothetical protein